MKMIGWHHHGVNAGKVHNHPANPGRSWSEAMHRLCEPVYRMEQTVRGKGHNEANLITDIEDKPAVWQIHCDCGWDSEGTLSEVIDAFKHHRAMRVS